jgi:hypothetical protein
VLGILTVYDIFKFRKTGSPQDMVLVLPQRLKFYIHYIIGLHYRRIQKDDPHKNDSFKLVLSAFITGCLVSLLEAVCTGQMYLPTIAFVLKVSALKIQAFGYLILYNLMFIVPLFAVFLFAFLGVSSGQFSQFMRRHVITIKIIMAILFFALGLILITSKI